MAPLDDSSRQPQLVGSDAWLLLSINLAAKGEAADLASIIGTGDAINHAVFTQQELGSGLARLVQRGYIGIQGSAFSVTARGKEVLERTEHASNLHARLTLLQEIFGATDRLDPAVDDPERHLAGIDREAVRRALDEYTKRSHET